MHLPPDFLPLATRSARVFAAVADFGLVMALVLVAVLSAAGEGVGGIFLAVLGFFGLLIYQIVLLSKEGQTIGKRWQGIRIVNEADGTNPGFLKAVIARSGLPAFISQIPVLGWVFVFANPLFVFRDDRKCLHDHIAGTIVVDTRASPVSHTGPYRPPDVLERTDEGILPLAAQDERPSYVEWLAPRSDEPSRAAASLPDTAPEPDADPDTLDELDKLLGDDRIQRPRA